MDGTQYFARPVTVTEERMRDAMERQAKQRALREALDSQMALRQQDAAKNGMSKAQLKRQEAMQAALEREREALGGGGGGGAFPAISTSASGTFGGTMLSGNQPHFNGAGRGAVPGASPSHPGYGVPHNAGGGVAVSSAYDAGDYPQRGHNTPRQLAGLASLEGGGGGLARPIPVMQQQQQQFGVGGGSSSGSGLFPPASGGPGGGPGAGGGGGRGLLDLVRSATDQPYQIREQNVREIEQYDREQPSPSSRHGGAHGRNGQQQVASRAGRATEAASRDNGGGGAPASRRESRDAVRKSAQEASRLQQLERDLQRREAEMLKLRDKERGWEQQVTALKAELKHAKVKERELARIAREKQPPPGQRAETAPQTGSIKPPQKHRQLQPLNEADRPQAPAGGKRAKPQPAQEAFGAGGGGHDRPSGAVPRSEFNETRVVTDKASLRPITAPIPLDPHALQERGALPPLPERARENFNATNSRPAFVSVKQNAVTAPQNVCYEKFAEMADAQIITAAQAARLWEFFNSGGIDMRKPTPPPIAHPDPNAAMRRSRQFVDAPLSSSGTSGHQHQQLLASAAEDVRTYETYAELDDSESGDPGDDAEYDDEDEDEDADEDDYADDQRGGVYASATQQQGARRW